MNSLSVALCSRTCRTCSPMGLTAVGRSGIGAMECEIGLVQLAEKVAIVGEDQPPSLHVGFRFLYFPLGQQTVGLQPCLSHFTVEAEGWGVGCRGGRGSWLGVGGGGCGVSSM